MYFIPVFFRQIGLDGFLERWLLSQIRLFYLGKRRHQSLDNQIVARSEMLVEATNRKACLFHDICNANAFNPKLAKAPGSNINNPLMSFGFFCL